MKERGKMGIVWYGDEENEGDKDDEVKRSSKGM